MFKGLFQLLMKKLGRKKKDPEAQEKDEEITSFSMNEGKPDQVFGVRREIVNGIGIFFIVIFCLAFIFATEDDEEETVRDNTPTVSDADIASLKKPKDLPNDYETLAKQNQAVKAEAAKAQTAQQDIKPKETATASAPAPAPAAVQIPRNYSATPVIPAQAPKTNSAPEAPKNDRYKSAISFALGGTSFGGADSAASGSEGSGGQVGVASGNSASGSTAPSYAQPNGATLNAGTTIPVRLLTGINTDVEGQVKAEVLADIYDSATGTRLLIPQGSKLTGSYESSKANNGRVPVTFRQLLLPDGGSWTIGGNLIAMDGAGFTGIQGKVHHHTGRKISGGAIGAGIAALGSLAAGNTSSRDTYTAGQLASQGALASMITASSQLLQQAANIQDTVTVEPGYEFSVYVTENLTF